MRGFEDKPVDWAPAIRRVTDDGTVQQRLQFMVPGVPQPKGSIIKNRYGGYRDSNKAIPEWLESVSAQARGAMHGRWRMRNPMNDTVGLPKFDMAVFLGVQFVMPRPKTLSPPKWMTGDAVLRWKVLAKNGMAPHIKKPDTDKLLRAIGDACTGIVYFDDSQVVAPFGFKRYADPGEMPGAIVCVATHDWLMVT